MTDSFFPQKKHRTPSATWSRLTINRDIMVQKMKQILRTDVLCGSDPTRDKAPTQRTPRCCGDDSRFNPWNNSTILSDICPLCSVFQSSYWSSQIIRQCIDQQEHVQLWPWGTLGRAEAADNPCCSGWQKSAWGLTLWASNQGTTCRSLLGDKKYLHSCRLHKYSAKRRGVLWKLVCWSFWCY